MRWLSFLLLANGTAAAQSTPGRAAKPLRFDFTLVAPIRDSFVFHVRGEERGWAVWQYELRSDEMGQEVLYTATSELRPVEWSNYAFFAAPLANAAPGDSLVGRAYGEFVDSLRPLVVVAETPTSVTVPAGRYDVLPLKAAGFRLFVTRTAPRRVVKGETLDGVFDFELAGSGPPARPGP
ncbi:MAG: hypothetical protein DMD74_02940 [Gemmatimonadetes bacterium]|nr:MAG: hypothetical protein DMD74_02940 [Gemmatimonadota bacterium]